MGGDLLGLLVLVAALPSNGGEKGEGAGSMLLNERWPVGSLRRSTRCNGETSMAPVAAEVEEEDADDGGAAPSSRYRS